MLRSEGPWLCLATSLIVACGSPSEKAAVPEAANATKAADPGYASRSCKRASAGGPHREGDARQGGSIALARQEGRLHAYVADTDERALHVIDVESGSSRTVSVAGAPEQAMVLADGRVVVTIADARRIEVYEPSLDRGEPLTKLCEREVPAGPFAIATSPNDSTLVVTSAWAPALTVLDPSDMTVRRVVELPRSPRGVLVDASGRAFVSHIAGGRVSVVDLAGEASPRSISLSLRAASPRPAAPTDLDIQRGAVQAYSLASISIGASNGETALPSGAKPPSATPPAGRSPSRIIVPMVSVDPGDENRRSSFYYGPLTTSGVAKHAPVGVVIDPAAERSLSTHVLAGSWDILTRECMLPRAIVVDSATARAFVACMGTDRVQVLDAAAADPMSAVVGRFEAPPGPTGLALDAAGETLVIWGEHSSRVRVVHLADRETRDIEIESSLDTARKRGRELFYASDDRGVSFDGLACASCHPDGGDDGLTWTTPEGPRQTLMLAGRLAGTAPYGWDRGSKTLQDYVAATVARLRGEGLSEADLGHLARYIEGLPAPPVRAESERARLGREVFVAEGCGTCHAEGTGTDGTNHVVEGFKAVDTPSLKHVGVTAPYFHDGRYGTLDGLLVHSTMGSLEQIRGERRVLLLEYLESL